MNNPLKAAQALKLAVATLLSSQTGAPRIRIQGETDDNAPASRGGFFDHPRAKDASRLKKHRRQIARASRNFNRRQLRAKRTAKQLRRQRKESKCMT